MAGHAEHGSAAGLPGLCRPLLTQPHHPRGDDHPQEHLHLLQGRAGISIFLGGLGLFIHLVSCLLGFIDFLKQFKKTIMNLALNKCACFR